ncbi:hypothetical protein [Streptomyces sp. SID13031]|uniref:hypothetical protein n=1 Tax=Streptomyces sp. SID13031 TaxID=2706046 RepID=UPI0013C78E8B|nr:hypothetical protein [Streptomyces sp. SID13031]NEA33472.1 hypothetical protein [Streptomyces sp. SID13031]
MAEVRGGHHRPAPWCSTGSAARPGARIASVAEFGVPGVLPVFCRLDQDDLTALTGLAERGELAVRVGACYPLERAGRRPQRAQAAGGTRGKIVIEIGGAV